MTAAAMATEKAATITAVSLPVTYSWKTEAASCMTRPSRPHPRRANTASGVRHTEEGRPSDRPSSLQ
jgi:hypothetical protein